MGHQDDLKISQNPLPLPACPGDKTGHPGETMGTETWKGIYRRPASQNNHTPPYTWQVNSRPAAEAFGLKTPKGGLEI